jgi:dephospho-CoA kinase
VLDEPDVVRCVADHFGPGVLDPQGKILRRALAECVFGTAPGHARALEWLESVVHPPVRRRIDAELASLQAGGGGVAVLDVPLLVQSGWDDFCDLLVVVECSADERRRRLAARRWSPGEQQAREAAWERRFPPGPLPAAKTLTVDASGDLPYTRHQVDLIWSRLRPPLGVADTG